MIFHGMLRIGGEAFNVKITASSTSIYDSKGRWRGRLQGDGRERIVFSACTADLNRDGADEVLLLTGDRGAVNADSLVIMSVFADTVRSGMNPVFKEERLQQFDLESLKPWKVQTADVDGDGRLEISIGVYKTAKFHPVMAKRPFLYNWSRDGILPKWLGSRLSRPFDDYVFGDVDGDGQDELIAIEHLADGRKAVNSYKWKGFGFESIGESRAYAEVTELKPDMDTRGVPCKIAARVKEVNDWKPAVLTYKDDKLVERID